MPGRERPFDRLDRTDKQILSALQRDGRMSNVALAAEVNLTPSPCLDRVKRLEKLGVISGYNAKLDREKLGLDLLVFVQVTLDRTAADVFDRFAEAVRAMPAVLECHMLAGGFDYLLKIATKDMAEFRALLGDRLTRVTGVAQTHTYVVMEEVKPSAPLPLDAGT